MAKEELKLYGTYDFKGSDQDPVIGRVETMINGHSYSEIAKISGVSPGTLSGWFKGRKVRGRIKKTKRPQYATIMAVVHACGYRTKFYKPNR